MSFDSDGVDPGSWMLDMPYDSSDYLDGPSPTYGPSDDGQDGQTEGDVFGGQDDQEATDG